MNFPNHARQEGVLHSPDKFKEQKSPEPNFD